METADRWVDGPASRRHSDGQVFPDDSCRYVISDIYSISMSPRDKPLAWLSGEIKTPPFGSEARIEAGFLLRRLQRGESLGLPHSRPMPSVDQVATSCGLSTGK